MDEVDFAVKSLAYDLKDGVRIARLCELHYRDCHLLSEMKYPAAAKSMMISNYEKIFAFLNSKDIVFSDNGSQMLAKDIVEGHREKTISFLWSLMSAWKIPILVDDVKLANEIRLLKKELSKKNIPIRSEVTIF